MTTNKQASDKVRKQPGSKPSGPQQAEQFMTTLEHPLKPEIEAVRTIIKSAHPGLNEHIKWNAPSFHYEGEDRITFQLRGKDFFLLVFHCGAKVKQRAAVEPLFQDEAGLLEWVSADRAIVKLKSMEEIDTKRGQLVRVINKWLEASGSSTDRQA